MSYLVLALAGIVAYVISTISGGGGALTLLPIVGFYIQPSAVAPVVNMGNMIGRPARLLLFWKHISWSIVKYYVPFAWLGAFLGAQLFVQLEVRWVSLLLGSFLILLSLQFIFSRKEKTFNVKPSYFMPLGFMVSIISTIFGATGALLNPFYLNLGLKKEELIATKTINSFLTGVVQISSYAFFGALDKELCFFGIAIGIGAIIGNVIGKRFLSGMSYLLFKRLVVVIMMVSGVLMIYRY